VTLKPGRQLALFRHYWVIFKLLINLGAVGVLLLYMQTLTYFADIAAQASPSNEDLAMLRRPRSPFTPRWRFCFW
jgi:hypothetical protein